MIQKARIACQGLLKAWINDQLTPKTLLNKFRADIVSKKEEEADYVARAEEIAKENGEASPTRQVFMTIPELRPIT